MGKDARMDKVRALNVDTKEPRNDYVRCFCIIYRDILCWLSVQKGFNESLACGVHVAYALRNLCVRVREFCRARADHSLEIGR